MKKIILIMLVVALLAVVSLPSVGYCNIEATAVITTEQSLQHGTLGDQALL